MEQKSSKAYSDSQISSKTFKKAADAAAAITIFSVLNGALCLVPHIIIASFFGLGPITDAYFMALAIIIIITNLLRMGTLPKLYISIFPKYIPGDKGRLELIVSNFFNVNLVIFSCVIFLVWVAMPYLVHWIAPGFNPETQMLTVKITRFLLPGIIYTAISGLFVAILHSHNRFSYPALVSPVPYLALAIFAMAGLKKFGIFSLVWGALVGYLLHLILLYVRMGKLGLHYKLALDLKMAELKNLVKLIIPFYVGGIVVQGKTLLQNALSSMLPSGSMSALTYGRRVRLYSIEYLLTTIPTVVYPSMTKKIASGDKDKLRDLLIKANRVSNFIVLPVLSWMVILSYQIVKLVFQRGAFDDVAAHNVTICMAILVLGLFPGATLNLLNRVLFAMQAAKWINFTKVTVEFMVIILTLILYKSLGLVGLALALACSTSIEFLFVTLYIHKKINLNKFFMDTSFLKILLITLVTGALCLATNNLIFKFLTTAGLWLQLLQIFVVIGVGAICYGALAYWFKLDEFRIIVDLLKQYLNSLLIKFSRLRLCKSPGLINQ